MDTNYEKRKEFSWHLICPDCIETERIPQFLPNCWANAMATCIGDNFCIAENLKAIYPSSIWITSLMNDFKKYKGLPLETIYDGFYIDREILKYFLKNYSISLESCHSQNATSAIVENFYEKLIVMGKEVKSRFHFPTIASKTILEKEELLFQCCDDCIVRNETSNLISCIDDSKRDKFECNNDLYKFKIFLDDINVFYSDTYYDFTNISKTMIKDVQMLMKTMLCSGPIIGNFFSNDNYQKYVRKIKENIKIRKDIEIPIFYQSEPIVPSGYNFNHLVEILGWGVESGWGQPNEEFWYIKDSNYPSLFLKIPFTTMSNLKFSIGPDFMITKKLIPLLDSFVSVFFSIKTKALDKYLKHTLIKNGIIKLSDSSNYL